MQPVYHAIDEKAAKLCVELNSHRPYVEGAYTKEYQNDVAAAYELAKQAQSMNPEYAAEAELLAGKYSFKLATWYNRHFSIESQYPSILICGAGNFNVRKKEKQNAARERHMNVYDEIQAIKGRIKGLATKKAAIKSSSPTAIQQLEKKVDSLRTHQNRMKSINAYYRKHKTLEGYEGMSSEEAEAICESMSKTWHPEVPFGSYSLSNNRQNLRSAEQRLKMLKAEKDQGTKVSTTSVLGEPVQIVENVELMRLQLLFEGKPSEEVRSSLKSNGFRWSPKNNAWQRQLTNNARYSCKLLLDKNAS